MIPVIKDSRELLLVRNRKIESKRILNGRTSIRDIERVIKKDIKRDIKRVIKKDIKRDIKRNIIRNIERDI